LAARLEVRDGLDRLCDAEAAVLVLGGRRRRAALDVGALPVRPLTGVLGAAVGGGGARDRADGAVGRGVGHESLYGVARPVV
jgi:hypothetical protein